MKFTTNRLSVENWRPALQDLQKRAVLESRLGKILTPNITRFLPKSMQYTPDRDSISRWVSDLDHEASVLCVYSRDSAKLVGLIILSRDPTPQTVSTVHLGYFLNESDWGKGYATELVLALISAFEKGNPTRLVAGVDRENTASARVLNKSGFTQVQTQSHGDQHMFEIFVPQVS